jgi:EREBP-like factor
MAARAHDVAVIAFRVRSACLNFADSAWLIRVPSSFSTVQELKQAAIEMAMALHSKNPSDPVENTSYSASSTETVNEHVASSSLAKSRINSASDDQIEFVWDSDMNLRLDYAGLAEEVMLNPASEWFAELEDDQWGTTVSLWS